MTILLIRHASAGDRYRWWGDDADRPLDERGVAEAAALVELLDDRPVTAVLSSSAARCQQTVAPIARRNGIEVEVHDALGEGGADRATLLVRRLAGVDTEATTVLCSHADVIPEVLRDLIMGGMHVSGGRGCANASVWELTVDAGEVVHGHYRQ
jgi:8-oxo-dGTP diphosphatase